MTTVNYEAPGHRLRIEGQCRDDDRDTIREALDTFARQAGGHLIVDLTAVTSMDRGVAEDLVAARSSCADGQTVRFRPQARHTGRRRPDRSRAVAVDETDIDPQNGYVTTVFPR
jgi:hypothetical protein